MSLPNGMEWVVEVKGREDRFDDEPQPWHCTQRSYDRYQSYMVYEWSEQWGVLYVRGTVLDGTISFDELWDLSKVELIIRAIEAPETLEVKE